MGSRPSAKAERSTDPTSVSRRYNCAVSISQATKLRWFDRGAAAFERTFPGVAASRLGPHIGPVYVCPICDQGFTREAVPSGERTAEHVPPESFGGRELLLTCKWCNNEAGSRLDAHARKKENIANVMGARSASRRRCESLIEGRR